MKRVLYPVTAGFFILISSGCGDINLNDAPSFSTTGNSHSAFVSNSTNDGPKLFKSLDRILVTERMYLTNEPTNIMWIYLESNGRIMARFPVAGNVMTSDKVATANFEDNSGDLPNELRTYQLTSDYVYWFTPNGEYHQFNGEYHVSGKPYEIDNKTGLMVTGKVDETEEKKRVEYQSQVTDFLFNSRVMGDFRNVYVEARTIAEEVVKLVNEVKVLKTRNTGDPSNWGSNDERRFNNVVEVVKEKEERYKYLVEWYNNNSSKYEKIQFEKKLLPYQLPHDYTTLEVY
ncbi:hypothetical protein POF51_25765 [Brevibacillus sp. AG]|uniref:hypothetical protein n=1 Tax=Brevibacillus sp. AG TaxID=3020891 RepID=UPI00232E20B9|nr:hypothetical protein [Brevibacillus sp. AG]MDC0764130.1 hypothetical protein [Brevibacillus sp. AG]